MSSQNPLRQIPWLPLFALVFAGGIAVYAVLHGSEGGSGALPPTLTAGPPIATEPPSVLFTSPVDGATVSNPVHVTMAIGGNLQYQGPNETDTPYNGHIFVLIDQPVPPPLTFLTADNTHVNLSNGGYQTDLPTIAPGDHTLTAIWVTSANYTGEEVISSTITVTVAPPSS